MDNTLVSSILTDQTHIKVQKYLDQYNMGIKVIEFKTCTKNSELAAQALGVTVAQIAKSLLFVTEQEPILVVTSGDMRVNQKKLKTLLNVKKIKFAGPEQVLEITGYPVGGVCPFDLKQQVNLFLDGSMQRFDVVYAAAGTPNSAVPVTVEQLQTICKAAIVDVS